MNEEQLYYFTILFLDGEFKISEIYPLDMDSTDSKIVEAVRKFGVTTLVSPSQSNPTYTVLGSSYAVRQFSETFVLGFTMGRAYDIENNEQFKIFKEKIILVYDYRVDEYNKANEDFDFVNIKAQKEDK